MLNLGQIARNRSQPSVTLRPARAPTICTCRLRAGARPHVPTPNSATVRQFSAQSAVCRLCARQCVHNLVHAQVPSNSHLPWPICLAIDVAACRRVVRPAPNIRSNISANLLLLVSSPPWPNSVAHLRIMFCILSPTSHEDIAALVIGKIPPHSALL